MKERCGACATKPVSPTDHTLIMTDINTTEAPTSCLTLLGGVMFATALRMIATHDCVVAIASTGKRRIESDPVGSGNMLGSVRS
jgi:hypothetical protein